MRRWNIILRKINVEESQKLDEDGEIGVVIPVSVHISDMLDYLYPEDKVDIVSEKGIILFRDAVVKDLFKEGGDN